MGSNIEVDLTPIAKSTPFGVLFAIGVRYGIRTHDLQGHNLTR